MKIKSHIVIGMSGGVDSSVSAWLLKRLGHKVTAVFMKNWEDDEEYCTSKQDFLDAAVIADLIGIPLEAVSFSKEYKEKVFNDFLYEYSMGRTPNPDVFCNSEIKFKAFLDYSLTHGADYLATGHYARIKKVEGKYNLLTALDKTKDQTYFLHRLSQKQLSYSVFPLGDYSKGLVRQMALELKLPNAKKPDSMGICFIGKRPFQNFLSKYIPPRPGLICTDEGLEVGTHHGLQFFTIGQRKGIGIGGLKKKFSESRIGEGNAWYVINKDFKNNRLIVVQGKNNPKLFSNSLAATNLHWIAEEAPACGSKLQVKIRHTISTFSGTISYERDKLVLNFEVPQRAVAPGQSVVFYKGPLCIGGGIIA
ncbi:MAG: tRNA 2-thiouridine(34) synthase MnmA [Betaproteobacteria bacterium TMED82]|nr:MAG: tRNA 2-thiouridine(34) synthase MnmA [Betaproteobacteria bacterium TMED82]|tara:strand:+ start:6705 stop:7796 length:1092 start_codon:yes stop_codon:yes gene_type:complete